MTAPEVPESSSAPGAPRADAAAAEPTAVPPARTRVDRRRVSLRTRLTLAVVALMAVVVVALSAVTALALRAYLVADLDSELLGTAARAVRALTGHELPGPGPSGAVGVPGQAPGTMAALVEGGTLTVAVVLDDRGATEAFDRAATVALGEVLDGRTVGVTFDAALEGRGDYRLTSVGLGEGRVLVLGLPLGEVDGIVGQYVWLAALVGVGVLIVAGAGAWAIGTALQRTTRRLETALAAEEASQARLRRFVADAGHELRTPLAAIRGYAELTRRAGAPLDDDVRHSLGRIEAESVRMTALIEDLLLLARLDESRPLAREPVELGGLVATAVGDALVAAPGHDWRVEAPEAVVVTGDTAKLQQAVVNLLANAAAHTPPGTRVVARVRVDGDGAVVEVEDDGPGIPPELLPTVFGRFVRGDASRVRRPGGVGGSTGLGLAIVAAIVAAHGGTAGVDSAPGRTTFRLRVPRGPRAPSAPLGAAGQRHNSADIGRI